MKFIDDAHTEELSFEVNVISLVDILFLLVIFFAVTTTFSAESGIQVELPKASAAKLPQSKEPITVTISPNSEISLQGKTLKLVDLSSALVAARDQSVKGGGAVSVVIRADKRVSHGEVVSVMELAKNAGLEDIAFATERGN
jgi:biopolymer transport protein ExbD